MSPLSPAQVTPKATYQTCCNICIIWPHILVAVNTISAQRVKSSLCATGSVNRRKKSMIWTTNIHSIRTGTRVYFAQAFRCLSKEETLKGGTELVWIVDFSANSHQNYILNLFRHTFCPVCSFVLVFGLLEHISVP